MDTFILRHVQVALAPRLKFTPAEGGCVSGLIPVSSKIRSQLSLCTTYVLVYCMCLSAGQRHVQQKILTNHFSQDVSEFLAAFYFSLFSLSASSIQGCAKQCLPCPQAETQCAERAWCLAHKYLHCKSLFLVLLAVHTRICLWNETWRTLCTCVPARLKKLRGWRSQTYLKAQDSAKLFRNVLGLFFLHHCGLLSRTIKPLQVTCQKQAWLLSEAQHWHSLSKSSHHFEAVFCLKTAFGSH